MAQQKLPFFKFDADNWLTGKIQLLSATEKGIFIDLLARMWKQNGFLKNDEILHRLLRIEKATLSDALQAFFDLKIMEEKDGILSVKFVAAQISELEEYKIKQKEFGAKGGRPKKGTKPIKNKKEDKDIKENTIRDCIKENPQTLNENDIFPHSVEDVMALAKSPAVGVICTRDDAEGYFIDRVSKNWIPYGQMKPIATHKQLCADLLKWLRREDNRKREENSKNANNSKYVELDSTKLTGSDGSDF